jgi:hypothetical protein
MRYDEDECFEGAYCVDQYPGVAWWVWGWEVEANEDTVWSGYYDRTGRVVCTMIGDDRKFALDPADVHQLAREDYCGECGQIGCCHDGYDREASSDE